MTTRSPAPCTQSAELQTWREPEEITTAAIAIADREGLDAVSMRRVAAGLGTGAASLYRYVETREDLLDLMTDAISAEYELAPPSSNWLADLIAFGEQARAIFRRHRWLAALAMTRPVIGPNGIGLIEHFLTVLQGIQRAPERKWKHSRC